MNVEYVLDWWFKSEGIVENWDKGGFVVDLRFERTYFEYGWEDIRCELIMDWWDDRMRMEDFWVNDGAFVDVCFDKTVKGGNVWLRTEVNRTGCVTSVPAWDEDNLAMETVREATLVADGRVLWLVLAGVMGGLRLETLLEDPVVEAVCILSEMWEHP